MEETKTKPQVIICSPLRRAIQTAQIVFKYLRADKDVRWTLDHNCREPITGPDDIGTPKEALQKGIK